MTESVAGSVTSDGAAGADVPGGGLRFGTAGLRAPMGPGPDRMNRDTVRRASAGLAAWVLARRSSMSAGSAGSIVVGFDARHHSAQFAHDAAAVFAGAGLRGRLMSEPTPTPVLAFAVRELGADAGVMITASHNPATDNGYKVYADDGAQIIPPADSEISALIDAAPAAGALALGDPEALDGEAIVARYLELIVPAALARAPAARDVAIVYTPVHGVGGAVMGAALRRAGFPAASVVAAQAEPDADFPTAPRPNPEEPGVLDLALAQARDEGADVVLANDPDADRLAVAIPWPGTADGWRRLTGDEVGGLLADALLGADADADGGGSDDGARPLVATSIVSASLLQRQAAAAGAVYAETLTGFKWIMHAAAEHPGTRLRFGYEQALGYGVTDLVRDKDGISAGLLVAALAAAARAGQTTIAARIDAIAERFGLYATAEHSIELSGEDGTSRAARIVDALIAGPPAALIGEPVTAVDDLATSTRRAPDGTSTDLGLPSAEGVVLHAGDRVRLSVRPSGTEPKLKLYRQVVLDVAPGEADATRALADERLRALAGEAEALVDRGR